RRDHRARAHASSSVASVSSARGGATGVPPNPDPSPRPYRTMPILGRFHYLEALPPAAAVATNRPRGAGGGLLGTLVLIHGFPLSARMWEGQLGLAAQGWRVIAPQLRGFDGTPAAVPAVTVDDFAGDLVDLLDGLHIDQAVIAGLSMGGYIAF